MVKPLAAIAAVLLLAGTAAAEEPPSWAYAIASEVMSPFCPGRTLAECPSSSAESLRMWIIVQAAAGRTRDDVEAELYERYGDQIRSTPKVEGVGIAAYVIPIVAFLAGGALLAWFLRRTTLAAAQEPRLPVEPLDPELERLLDEELSR